MNTFAKAVGLFATGALILAAPASADDGEIRGRTLRPRSRATTSSCSTRPTARRRRSPRSRRSTAPTSSTGYTSAVQGFSAEMTREQALELSTDPAVDYVEQDRTFTIAGTQAPTPSWGLDRIDQRDLPLNNTYTYPDTAGRASPRTSSTPASAPRHTDFGGRAIWGTDTIDDGNNTDCNGHGTHVAGTVGGTHLRRRQGRQARRGPGPGLRGQRHLRRRHRRHRLGHRNHTPVSRRSPT